MKYLDGQEVKVGDRVHLGDDDRGIVVCSMDAGEYTENHSKEQWEYLRTGVMIEFPRYGLTHLVEPDEDLRLIERGGVG